VQAAGSDGKFCPVEPETWLHKAETNPNKQKVQCLWVITLGGGSPGVETAVFVTVAIVAIAKKTRKLAVCCWANFGPTTHSIAKLIARTSGSYFWESNAQLLLGIDSQK
jgi:hypothetical protein